jgi:protein-disulfide isomerase
MIRAAIWLTTGFLIVSASAASAQTAGADPLASRTKGSPKAPVTVYEMSDFQCPFCRTFALEIFPELDRRYIKTGKVRWVFINFPLTSIHPHAAAAGELGLCAAKQGGFWKVHDLLFQHQAAWAPLNEAGPFFVSLADSAGLSKNALIACVAAPETMNDLKAEAEGAQRAGAGSTPSFYIEGGLMSGAQPADVFALVLDSIYAEKTSKKVRSEK